MKIKMVSFHNVQYQTPEDFEFLDKSLDDYPSFCGAGSGIGDKIVPEKIGGMPCSHICHIHDEWWTACPPEWIAFLRGNMAFGYNLAVYLGTGKGNFFIKLGRLVKGAVYVGAVSTVGWKIFKNLKGII